MAGSSRAGVVGVLVGVVTDRQLGVAANKLEDFSAADRAWCDAVADRRLVCARIAAELAEAQVASGRPLFELTRLDLFMEAMLVADQLEQAHVLASPPGYLADVEAAMRRRLEEVIVGDGDDDVADDSKIRMPPTPTVEAAVAKLLPHEAQALRRAFGFGEAAESADPWKPPPDPEGRYSLVALGLPHLFEGRLVAVEIPVGFVDDLGECDVEDGRIGYTAIDGTRLEVPEPVYRWLDAALERVLPLVLQPRPDRPHPELDQRLAAGPGPFGFGVRALGYAPPRPPPDPQRIVDALLRQAVGTSEMPSASSEAAREIERVVLVAEQRLRQRLEAIAALPPDEPALRSALAAARHAADEAGLYPAPAVVPRRRADPSPSDDGAEMLEEGDGRPREPWREFVGDLAAVRAWLRARLKHANANDCDLPRGRARRRACLGELWEAKCRLVEDILDAFPPDRARFFHGAHAGWDRDQEDPMARDEVTAAVDDDAVLILYARYDRWYG